MTYCAPSSARAMAAAPAPPKTPFSNVRGIRAAPMAAAKSEAPTPWGAGTAPSNAHAINAQKILFIYSSSLLARCGSAFDAVRKLLDVLLSRCPVRHPTYFGERLIEDVEEEFALNCL